MERQAVALEDFQVTIGEKIKIYPFLTQKSFISGHSTETFMDVGRSSNGVVYFEQSESWGGCFPHSKNNKVALRVKITDSFGGKHYAKFPVRRVDLAEARKYNPSFGLTLSMMSEDCQPRDLPVDDHGNLLPSDFNAQCTNEMNGS